MFDFRFIKSSSTVRRFGESAGGTLRAIG